jgi:hypothetical protein
MTEKILKLWVLPQVEVCIPEIELLKCIPLQHHREDHLFVVICQVYIISQCTALVMHFWYCWKALDELVCIEVVA